MIRGCYMVKYFSIIFWYSILCSISSLAAGAVGTVQTYESLLDLPSSVYLKKLGDLEKYLENPANISSCNPLSTGAGINLTYKVRYKNGLEGILKYHTTGTTDAENKSTFTQTRDDLDKVQREVAAFVIAKDVGMRAVAPIVAMTYKGTFCPDIAENAQVAVSYFIKDSRHLTSVAEPDEFAAAKKSFDWFNFLIFDCDHGNHNILKTTTGKQNTYLFDYDWAFSYPREVREQVHVQEGYETWCSDYIALIPRLGKLPKVGGKQANLCMLFPNLSSPRLLEKIRKYAQGIFPAGFPRLRPIRTAMFKSRANHISNTMTQCPTGK